jgi:hypothetical protein
MMEQGWSSVVRLYVCARLVTEYLPASLLFDDYFSLAVFGE